MGRARALSATVSEERGRAEYASTASALADRVEQSPDDVELRLALATALLRIDDPEGALREYEEALRRAPDDCEAGLGRARVELRLGSVDVARAHLERLLVQHPGCAEGHGLLGSAELRAGRPPEAELAYARAVELDPWNPSYRLGLANSRLRRGDLAGARTASAEAETLDPKDVDVQDLKARLQAIPPGYRFALYTGLRADRLTHGRDDWMQETAHLGWHAREELELGAGFEHFRRYGEDDFQASVDGAWRVDDAWTLSSVLVYGGEAEVVAQESFELEVARRIGSSASAVLRWRHAWYAEDVQVDVYSPGVEVAFGPSTSVLARYYHVDESEGDGGDAGSLRLALFPEGTWRPRFEVGYGNEAVVSRSAQEPSRDTDVFALSAGLDWVCSQRTRIALTGDYEKHQSDYEKYGLSLGVTVGF
jgi:YaiO family outer membrane protein